MSIFNFFQSGKFSIAVKNIENKIIDSDAYLYFNRNKAEDDKLPLALESTYLLDEYKKFEVSIISTAIVAVLFEIDMKDSGLRDILKNIYLEKSTKIIKLLNNGELKIRDLEISVREKKYGNAFLNLKIGTKFEKYYEEIKESLEIKSIYSYWKYEIPEQKWDSVYKVLTDELIEGEDRLYTFLWNLFLCYESIDYEIFDYDQKCISFKIFLDLNEDELSLMKKFILEIRDYKNK